MTEINILEDRQKILGKPAASPEPLGMHGQGVGCRIIRRIMSGFRIVNKDRLKETEKTLIKGFFGVRPGDDNVRVANTLCCHQDSEGVFLHNTVTIDKEQDVAPRASGANISRRRRPH